MERQDHLHARLYFGGYSASLFGPERPPSQRGCIRVAIFRDPFTRLASAITYCRHAIRAGGVRAWESVQMGGDELCGGKRNGSVEEWAKHFGSWTYRQLLLQPDMLAMLRTPRSHESLRRDAPTKDSHDAPAVWLKVKRAIADNDYDRRRTSIARKALHRLESALLDGSLLHVIGIFEQWKTTMSLFDALLPLAGKRLWARASSEHQESYGSHSWRHDKSMELSTAKQSSAVARLLEADIRLYEAALARFHALCTAHRVREVS